MDKQGILSWPNPSPETVLFFSGRVEPPHNSQEDLQDDLSVSSYYRMEAEDRDGVGVHSFRVGQLGFKSALVISSPAV